MSQDGTMPTISSSQSVKILPLVGLMSLLVCPQLIGCKGRTPDNGPAASRAEPHLASVNTGMPNAFLDTVSDVDAKLGVYVRCYNSVDESGHRTIARYASWVRDLKLG